MDIEFYCADCYRSFKSLSHFNRRHSRCAPILRGKDAKKYKVERIKGGFVSMWALEKKEKEWKKKIKVTDDVVSHGYHTHFENCDIMIDPESDDTVVIQFAVDCGDGVMDAEFSRTFKDRFHAENFFRGVPKEMNALEFDKMLNNGFEEVYI